MSTLPPMIQEPPVIQSATSGRGAEFPQLEFGFQPVNAGAHVENGTGASVTLGYFLTALGVLIGGLATFFIIWPILLFKPLSDYFQRRKLMALLKGSSLEVGPDQFPEVHRCAEAFAQRLGMKNVPVIFIVEDNQINAMAQKVAGRQVIVLLDDVVDACLRSGDPRTLAFILAHEMAHHALGHTDYFRSLLRAYHKKLSRLDELSCDAVAHQLVGDPRAAAKALTILLVGPHLVQFVNHARLSQQALEVTADRHSKKAERNLTHPLLLRRLGRFLR